MLAYQCACGRTMTFEPDRAGSLERCPACNSPFMVPSRPGEELPSSGVEPIRPPARFADQTSTAHLCLLMLVFGPMAAALSYLAAGACAGSAILINIVHNLLPVFVFAMPIVIVIFMAITPAVYGLGVGAIVGEGAALIRHRHAVSAGLIALFWAVAGLAAFPYFASLWTPPGRSFFDDTLLPFVNLMIGGCLNFTWLEKPEPIEVSTRIVYGVLGTSALLGLACAYGNAEEKAQPHSV